MTATEVLATLDRASSVLIAADSYLLADEISEARAAVAMLIEASRKLIEISEDSETVCYRVFPLDEMDDLSFCLDGLPGDSK